MRVLPDFFGDVFAGRARPSLGESDKKLSLFQRIRLPSLRRVWMVKKS